MKAYKCPECNEVSSSADWNEVTDKQVCNIGAEKCSIEEENREDYIYVCPKCLLVADGEDILEAGIA